MMVLTWHGLGGADKDNATKRCLRATLLAASDSETIVLHAQRTDIHLLTLPPPFPFSLLPFSLPLPGVALGTGDSTQNWLGLSDATAGTATIAASHPGQSLRDQLLDWGCGKGHIDTADCVSHRLPTPKCLPHLH